MQKQLKKAVEWLFAFPKSSARVEACRPNVARYQAYRGQIEHEDHLLGVRVGWLIATEAFLFLAYANLANADHLCKQAAVLFAVLPWIGGLIAFFVGLAILAAIFALRELRKAGRKVAPTGFPQVLGSRATHWSGLAPPIAIPIALILVWLYVGLVQTPRQSTSCPTAPAQSSGERHPGP